MTFTIKSADFKDNGPISKKFTCDGEDLSPELSWTDPPQGAKSYALIVEDPDAPTGTFLHWVVYDIPADFKGLKRGMLSDDYADKGVKQGKTGFGPAGWGGPCPPKGHGRHRYIFILKALDVPSLGLANGAVRLDVEKAAKGRVLGEARITGVYQR
ncbi:MAG: YbhB/YbcL family Raf kinase inhibitor-like protein [Deltaproteobacteria bacterium]|nr:YbhB/YbcL family Raf kinase inhibitor-like protein [Deltaproteobacteria bacterium]